MYQAGFSSIDTRFIARGAEAQSRSIEPDQSSNPLPISVGTLPKTEPILVGGLDCGPCRSSLSPLPGRAMTHPRNTQSQRDWSLLDRCHGGGGSIGIFCLIICGLVSFLQCRLRIFSAVSCPYTRR